MTHTPIYADLDGTLVRSDLFIESMIASAKADPLKAARVPMWLLRGIPAAKTLAARHGRIAVETLPYDRDVVDYLAEQRRLGRPVYLATACHRSLAQRVANHLGIFDGVIATSARENAKGIVKLQRIRDAQAGAFVYAGDSNADRPLWDAAAAGIFVRAPQSAVNDATKSGKVERIFAQTTSSAAAVWRALRPHQWAKNALLFVPLLTAHLYADPAAVAAAFIAFVAFCLCASSAYLLNDLLDLEADRRHARKRNRPLASGALSLATGIMLIPLLLAIAVTASVILLPWPFLFVLLLYYATTCAYSWWLKRVSTIDVMTLAGLYTTRVLAGAAAIAVVPSFWLLALSMFLFLSLAYVKRYTELRIPTATPSERVSGRGYAADDAESMFILGAVSGVGAVLVMALYINSPEVALHYSAPQFLWSLCLVLLYWINRIWIGARRGKIHDDPVVFALTDRVSLALGAVCIVAVLAARFVQL